MEHSKNEICCFTGHRAYKMPWGSSLTDARLGIFRASLSDAINDAYTDGFRRFICGMAVGCDTWFCEELIRLKPQLTDLYIEAAIPCPSQADKWSARDRELYLKLLKECDEVNLLQNHYTPDCMEKRNQYMVDKSALLIAAYNGRPGGAMSTVRYALRQNKEIRYVAIPE